LGKWKVGKVEGKRVWEVVRERAGEENRQVGMVGSKEGKNVADWKEDTKEKSEGCREEAKEMEVG
jgi:hypothetical protein